MTLIERLSQPDLGIDGAQSMPSSVYALVQLVDGPPSEQPDPVKDAKAWLHTAFHTYRKAMADNDPCLPYLARIKHNFIKALEALDFDDQMRQLGEALTAMRSFHRAFGCNCIQLLSEQIHPLRSKLTKQRIIARPQISLSPPYLRHISPPHRACGKFQSVSWQCELPKSSRTGGTGLSPSRQPTDCRHLVSRRSHVRAQHGFPLRIISAHSNLVVHVPI